MNSEASNRPKNLPAVDFSAVDWPSLLLKHIDNQSLCIDGGRATRRKAPCPICGGKDRFQFDNKDNTGSAYCQKCGGMSGLKLLMLATGKTMREAMAAITGTDAGASSIPVLTPEKRKEQERLAAVAQAEKVKIARKRLIKTWSEARAITNTTTAGQYLVNRVPGLDLSKLSGSLRHAVSLGYFGKEIGGNLSLNFPALLCKVKTPDCTPISLHRTYLTPDGQKAKVEQPKKLMTGVRKLQGAAIHLNTSTSRKLVIAEGVETGLAVLAAHDYQVTVWSLISAVNMGMAEVPDGRFDEVVIYADHDPIDPKAGYRPGEHFAEMLKENLLSRNIKCRIVLPPVEGKDFADMWTANDPFELCV